MRSVAIFCLLALCGNLHAAVRDLTGNYTGCGELSSLGKRQVVLILVKMPTGFDFNEFRYTGGFYWKAQDNGISGVGADYFTDVQIDDSSLQILMRTEIKPLHDFGVIAKTVKARILTDGSLEGEFLSNAAGSNGGLQKGKFHVFLNQEKELPLLDCSKWPGSV